MNRTNWDENQDKLEIVPHESYDYFHNILIFKEKLNWSWMDIAKNLYYYFHKYNETLSTEAQEIEEIQKFKDCFRKAIERKQPSCKLGSQKFTVREYYEALRNLPKTQEFDEEDEDLLRSQENDINELNHWVVSGAEISEFHKYCKEKRDYFKKISLIAEKYPFLQTLLGHFYYYAGEGELPQFKKALKYYEMAAESDNQVALFQLGNMYEYGYGVEEDKVRAANYYKLSAKKNYPLALNKIAYLYYCGDGVVKDNSLFFKYAEESANLGDDIGLLHLGLAYENGWGTEKNIRSACDIYKKLAEKELNQWSYSICIKLALLYRNHEAIKSMEDANFYFEKAKNDVIQWFNIAWNNKNTELLDILSSSMEITPEVINRISKHQHYDNVHRPEKPTAIKALFSF